VRSTVRVATLRAAREETLEDKTRGQAIDEVPPAPARHTGLQEQRLSGCGRAPLIDEFDRYREACAKRINDGRNPALAGPSAGSRSGHADHDPFRVPGVHEGGDPLGNAFRPRECKRIERSRDPLL
jgi:hypothetical protein